jgi:hypothetical protein
MYLYDTITLAKTWPKTLSLKSILYAMLTIVQTGLAAIPSTLDHSPTPFPPFGSKAALVSLPPRCDFTV